jgi:hypothetical protein
MFVIGFVFVIAAQKHTFAARARKNPEPSLRIFRLAA